MAGIHRDDQVERCEIVGADRSGALIADIDAAGEGRLLRSRVGWLARVPGARTGGVHADPVRQVPRPDKLQKHAFGSRGPADIAGTDEQNAEHAMASLW